MDEDSTDFRLKIDGKWLLITRDFQKRHPGGSVIIHYRDADATQVFMLFMKEVEVLINNDNCIDEINVSSYNLSETKEKQIVKNFVTLREELIAEGLFDHFVGNNFGWLTHDFCHQQPSKNRQNNDFFSLIFGNIVQGFSRDWWKEKHNTHHAATNIVGQ
ncbi:hypothetical protein WUBG_10548, partial [Wuchereria bancrofti]